MVQVPANDNPDYIRFREELKQRLIDQGDECFWEGLVMEDASRLSD